MKTCEFALDSIGMFNVSHVALRLHVRNYSMRPRSQIFFTFDSLSKLTKLILL